MNEFYVDFGPLKFCGGKSLKDVTLNRLDRAIQAGPGGHDSVEDTMAARDIAEWYGDYWYVDQDRRIAQLRRREKEDAEAEQQRLDEEKREKDAIVTRNVDWSLCREKLFFFQK
jgi:hypothetical protein